MHLLRNFSLVTVGTRKKRFGFYILILALVVLFLVISVSSIRSESATTDETWHVSAGLALLRTGDFRMNTDNPYPPNVLAALPLALDKNFKLPTLEDISFKNAQINFFSQKIAELNGGLLDGEKYSLSADSLFKPRVMMISLAAIFLLIYGLVLKRNFNGRVAVLAVILLGFSPTFIAHARLTTTDVSAAITIFLATYVLWRTHRSGPPRLYIILLIVFLVISFIALMAKNTTLLVSPFWLFLSAYSIYKKIGMRPLGIRILASIAVPLCFLLFWGFGIYAAYGFTYKTLRQTRHNDYISIRDDKRILLAQRNSETLIKIYDQWKVPAPYYLQGVVFNMIFKEIRGHESFFLGKFENIGPWYYSVAFFVKETIPFVLGTLFLVPWVFMMFFRGKHRDGILFLGVVPATIFLIFSLSSVKIGIRHILPIYPFLALGVAVMTDRFMTRRGVVTRRFVYVCGVSIIISVLGTYPFYISYFNLLAGGSRNGYKWVQDSNFDWGQNELRARQIAEASGGQIHYEDGEFPKAGNYYLLRVSSLYAKQQPLDERLVQIKKMLEENKISVARYSMSTHWLTYYPDINIADGKNK